MARNTPFGIDGLGLGNTGNSAELPYLRRGKLKTIKQSATARASTSGTQAAGAPQVDTFAREGVPNVTYTLGARRT